MQWKALTQRRIMYKVESDNQSKRKVNLKIERKSWAYPESAAFAIIRENSNSQIIQS